MRIEIGLEATDPDRMRPGMRFRGSIEVERKDNVLLIPVDAVFASPTGPSARVTRLGRTSVVPLTVGESDGKSIEVISGLEEGDRILTARQTV